MEVVAMGAVQALKAEGKNDQVFTVGMGMYAGGPESIKAGDLNASWELFPAELGRLAGESAVKILAGEKVEPLISTDMVFVTKDNIGEFLKCNSESIRTCILQMMFFFRNESEFTFVVRFRKFYPLRSF